MCIRPERPVPGGLEEHTLCGAGRVTWGVTSGNALGMSARHSSEIKSTGVSLSSRFPFGCRRQGGGEGTDSRAGHAAAGDAADEEGLSSPAACPQDSLPARQRPRVLSTSGPSLTRPPGSAPRSLCPEARLTALFLLILTVHGVARLPAGAGSRTSRANRGNRREPRRGNRRVRPRPPSRPAPALWVFPGVPLGPALLVALALVP